METLPFGKKIHHTYGSTKLKAYPNQTIHTPKQQKWISKLTGYHYEVHYKPDRDNKVANAPSRTFVPEFHAITVLTAPWLDKLCDYFSLHPAGIQFRTKLESTTGQENFSEKKDFIYYKQHLYIPDVGDIKLQLLQELHTSPTGGHSGKKMTLARLSAVVYWPEMKNTVENYTKQCHICQLVKYQTSNPYVLLNPLPIPENTWEDISMDFITHLPNSNGKSTIWVLVDRLSKFASFISLPPKFNAAYLANIFIFELYSFFWLPKSIVLDQDLLFLSHFWQELFKQVGTTLKFSSAYHSQTNGQSKVVNGTLEGYLRFFTVDQPKKWTRFLPLAQFWYNSTKHSSTWMTPYQGLFGKCPKTYSDLQFGIISQRYN